ncbi:sulfotransferase [Mameliella sp. CS4]|uniref:sulfotransferase n=1 Tax=Mameliella sp. CS4 TaxID=2862329 RepID=UPI001C5D4F24|nr:sulfotransferase [Mameliella sp. CS4]MBW4986040.1 sulfotransferase [Mameliella sp. CS4]
MRDRPIGLMISGSGRSGTTILSILLSQGENVVNIGQLRDVWVGWARDVPCTCGKSLTTCEFWGGIRAEAFPGQTAEEADRIDAGRRAFMTEAAGLRDWNAPDTLAHLAQAHPGFLAALASLLKTLVSRTGARVLVDSSKSPEFALACHLTGVADLYVLNLIRDPRAVACSWAKRKPRSINQRLDAWGQRQRRLTGWQAADGLHHRSLRYEDFTDTPQQTLSKVLDWVGEDLPSGVFETDRKARVSWARQHLFPPSNEKVLAELRTEVEVRAPSDWRAARHWPLHLKALMRSFPQGPAYVLGLDSPDRRLKS